MPGIVHPDIPHPGLFEDHLPGLPVLGSLDWAAVAGGEDEVIFLPAVSGLLSAEPEHLTLPDAERRGDRPAGTVPPGAGHVEVLGHPLGPVTVGAAPGPTRRPPAPPHPTDPPY
ncbi:hypothetical protein GCM10010156_70600 [Planobispora rosea]|uniref:Uncharacterized protein n=1 Tax=Planobispora rosea TaxID=35762 RepID=A0A8J3S818_PLARO|nr:hypothetical protein GCM10010156_70600 [Planobispora rosea]GIH88529.1 hypothetical protein Pro02_69370 [Planobispora rosea]